MTRQAWLVVAAAIASIFIPMALLFGAAVLGAGIGPLRASQHPPEPTKILFVEIPTHGAPVRGPEAISKP